MITQDSYFLVENDEVILKIKKIFYSKKKVTQQGRSTRNFNLETVIDKI